jgi:hypothetical protein
MFYTVSISDVFNYILGNFNWCTRFPEDGTDVPKRVGMVKAIILCV